jgi:hypothetical protein
MGFVKTLQAREHGGKTIYCISKLTATPEDIPGGNFMGWPLVQYKESKSIKPYR